MGKFSRVCVSSSVEQIVHRVAVKFNSLEQSIGFTLRSCHNVPEMREKIVGAKLGSNPDRLARTVSDSLVHDALERG